MYDIAVAWFMLSPTNSNTDTKVSRLFTNFTSTFRYYTALRNHLLRVQFEKPTRAGVYVGIYTSVWTPSIYVKIKRSQFFLPRFSSLTLPSPLCLAKSIAAVPAAWIERINFRIMDGAKIYIHHSNNRPYKIQQNYQLL